MKGCCFCWDCTRNTMYLLFVLGLFTLPFEDRFPDTKIAIYSWSLNWFVFCVLFPVFHCSCLFYFSQSTSCFLLHDSHSCRLVPQLFPLFSSVLGELYPYYKCIHFTLFGKISLNIMINVRKNRYIPLL